jgi:DNA polymerase III delta prime subunit
MYLEKVKSIKKIGIRKVRNLTVYKNHTFITKNGIVTHNCERLSNAAQDSCKSFFEQYHKACRFILTCNSINKIIEPIKSRCTMIDFSMSDVKIKEEMLPKIYKRLTAILKNEKIEFVEEAVNKIIERYYPDIRSMIKILQQYSDQNGTIDNNIFNFLSLNTEFYEMIYNKKFQEARNYILQKNMNYGEIYRQLYDQYLALLLKNDKSKYGQSLILISEYSWRQSQGVIDPEINFAALLMELIGIL